MWHLVCNAKVIRNWFYSVLQKYFDYRKNDEIVGLMT